MSTWVEISIYRKSFNFNLDDNQWKELVCQWRWQCMEWSVCTAQLTKSTQCGVIRRWWHFYIIEDDDMNNAALLSSTTSYRTSLFLQKTRPRSQWHKGTMNKWRKICKLGVWGVHSLADLLPLWCSPFFLILKQRVT